MRDNAGKVMMASPSQLTERIRIRAELLFCRFFGIFFLQVFEAFVIRLPPAMGPEPVGGVSADSSLIGGVDLFHNFGDGARPSFYF